MLRYSSWAILDGPYGYRKRGERAGARDPSAMTRLTGKLPKR
jgi:hypothetical protein